MLLIKSLPLFVSQIGLFWQEKINGQIFRWNLVFILGQVAILFVKFNNLPPQIPLFYSRPWGESQLTPVSSIFILPALSIFIMLINNLLAIFFLKSGQLLSRILVVVSLICSALATFALFQVISLVS